MVKRIGKQTLRFDDPPAVLAWGCVGSKKEREGPLGGCFDYTDDDMHFGQDSWEKAESFLQQKALALALEKAALSPGDLDYLLAGDLLNQCIASTYGLRDFNVPFLGLFGACSSSALGTSLAAMLVAGGFARKAAAVTSSHFATAERQFRFPLQYGSQRAPSAQWTATASGALILGDAPAPPYIREITNGKIVDLGITDLNNMGAAMAPADDRIGPYRECARAQDCCFCTNSAQVQHNAGINTRRKPGDSAAARRTEITPAVELFRCGGDLYCDASGADCRGSAGFSFALPAPPARRRAEETERSATYRRLRLCGFLRRKRFQQPPAQLRQRSVRIPCGILHLPGCRRLPVLAEIKPTAVKKSHLFLFLSSIKRHAAGSSTGGCALTVPIIPEDKSDKTDRTHKKDAQAEPCVLQIGCCFTFSGERSAGSLPDRTQGEKPVLKIFVRQKAAAPTGTVRF